MPEGVRARHLRAVLEQKPRAGIVLRLDRVVERVVVVGRGSGLEQQPGERRVSAGAGDREVRPLLAARAVRIGAALEQVASRQQVVDRQPAARDVEERRQAEGAARALRVADAGGIAEREGDPWVLAQRGRLRQQLERAVGPVIGLANHPLRSRRLQRVHHRRPARIAELACDLALRVGELRHPACLDELLRALARLLDVDLHRTTSLASPSVRAFRAKGGRSNSMERTRWAQPFPRTGRVLRRVTRMLPRGAAQMGACVREWRAPAPDRRRTRRCRCRFSI